MISSSDLDEVRVALQKAGYLPRGEEVRREMIRTIIDPNEVFDREAAQELLGLSKTAFAK